MIPFSDTVEENSDVRGSKLNSVFGFDDLTDQDDSGHEIHGVVNLGVSVDDFMNQAQEMVGIGPLLDRSGQLAFELQQMSKGSGSTEPCGSTT